MHLKSVSALLFILATLIKCQTCQKCGLNRNSCQTPWNIFTGRFRFIATLNVRSDTKIREGGLMLKRCVNSPRLERLVSTPQLPLPFTSRSHAHGIAKRGKPDRRVRGPPQENREKKCVVSHSVPKLPVFSEDNFFLSLLLTSYKA